MGDERNQVITLAAKLAQEKVEKLGYEYKKAIEESKQEACILLGIDYKRFIDKCRRHENV